MNDKDFHEKFGDYPNDSANSLAWHIFEGKIKRAVRNELDRLIEEKSILQEYYANRKNFVKLVYNLFDQIFQNYCLVYYGEKTNRDVTNHWRNELMSYYNRILNTQITENDSPKSRYKAITQAFDLKMEKFDASLNSFYAKLNDEGINKNDQVIKEGIEDFMNNIDEIKKILSKINWILK